MIGRQRPVDRCGERAGLHRADAHDAHAVCPRCGHHLPRFSVPVEEFEATRRVEQICDALYCCRCRAFTEKLDDRIGMADARQSPCADDAFADQLLEHPPDILNKCGIKRHARGAVTSASNVGSILHNIRVLEEQVEAVRAEPGAGALEKARAVGYLAGVALRAIEAGNLAARIEMLEAVLKQRDRDGRQ